MSRLPIQGSDSGTWGTILNDFLAQSLAADGTVKPLTIGTSQLSSTAVTSTKLGLSAVTTAAIADTNVTKAKLYTSVQASLASADTALQVAPVTSVATRTGDVVLTRSDVGLDQVDNTSDINKPISTATQNAINTAASNAPGSAFDIKKSNPRYMTSLLGVQAGMVSRCAVKSPDTGDIYVSQSTVGSNGSTSPYETMIISRLGSDGIALDSMTCTDGGHGFNFALEYSSGTMYVWCAYQKPLGAGNQWDLVRFPYAANATITRSDASIQTMNKFTTDYTTVAFDWANDYIAFRRSGTSIIYELRKISEVKAGTNTVYNTMTITENPPTFRGFATIDSNLYISYGALNETSGDTDCVKTYKWSDGTLITSTATGSLGKMPNGTYLGNTYEQGSCSLYRDPVTGSAALLVTVTLNTSLNYSWQLFIFPTQGTNTFTGGRINTLQKALPTLTSFEARRLNGSSTMLSSVTTPGWFYFSPTEIQAMTDMPNAASLTEGYFLQVSGKDTQASVIQTLYRNSSVSPDQYVRSVGTSGAISPWTQTIHNGIAGLTSGPDISDQGYLGWSFPPDYVQTGVKTQFNGGLNGVRIRIPSDCTITNIHIVVSSAISRGTAGANGLALYDNSGNLLGDCGDMTTTWGSIGVKKVPLASPVPVKAGYVAVAFWSTIGGGNSASPQFFNGENVPQLGLYNDNLTAGNYRYFLGATSGVTTAPATIGPQSLCGTAWWCAVS